VAGDFAAGAIVVDLKSQVDALKAGTAAGKTEIKSFGNAVEDTANRVESSGKKISTAIDGIDAKSVRIADKFLKITAHMIAMQTVLESVQGHKGMSGLQVALEAGATSLQRFIMVFGLMPGVGGAALGSIVALISGYSTLTKAIDEVEKKQRELNRELDRNVGKVISALAREDVKSQILPESQGPLVASIASYTQQLEAADKAARELSLAETMLAAQAPVLQRQIDDLTTKIDAMSAAAGELDAIPPDVQKLSAELAKLNLQMEVLQRNVTRAKAAMSGADIEGTARKIRDLKEALDFAKTEEQARKLISTIGDVQIEGQRAVELGLDTPLQAAQKNLQATEAALRKIIAAEEDLKKAMALVGDNEELRNAIQQQLALLQESEAALGPKAQIAKAELESKQAAGQYAQGLASSIGQAVSNGILNGEKAMTILADVGRNLFANMLNNVVDTFQKGMIAAFQSIAGQGGEILGGALTAVLGVVGGILSRKRSGSQSFGGVQSGITSNEAVRGIVAGPTNVAIAAVGEDISRSMAPVVIRLDTIATILRSIDGKTRTTGGVGFSSPAVMVPTA